MHKQLFTKLTALAAVALLATNSAQAATPVGPVSKSVTSIVTLDVGCSNNPGPVVTIGGEILIGSFTVPIELYQNKNKNEVLVEKIDVTVGLATPIKFSKIGFTGNPSLTAQFQLDGENYGGPISLGKCVKIGHKKTPVPIPTDLLVALLVDVLDCSNSPGPQITLTGTETVLDGVSVEITGTNGGGNHVKTETADVVVASASFPLDGIVVIPKQDVGGNPIVYVAGQRLGRCNKL